ncbi:hypothetical protein QF002_007986 [Paraburkholderia youngii]
MKMSHRMKSDSPGPVWGLITGIFLMVAGIGIWIYVQSSKPGNSIDESLAMAAMLVGAFSGCLRRPGNQAQTSIVPQSAAGAAHARARRGKRVSG